MRSAGFEPAIPSLGRSYLNQAGLTSLAFTDGEVKDPIVDIDTSLRRLNRELVKPLLQLFYYQTMRSFRHTMFGQ